MGPGLGVTGGGSGHRLIPELMSRLREARLARVFGLEAFRPGQRPRVDRGRAGGADVLCVMPTVGGGK